MPIAVGILSAQKDIYVWQFLGLYTEPYGADIGLEDSGAVDEGSAYSLLESSYPADDESYRGLIGEVYDGSTNYYAFWSYLTEY